MHKRHCKILGHCYKAKFPLLQLTPTIEWYKENLDVFQKLCQFKKEISVIYMHDAQNLFDAKNIVCWRME
jgi:hypothetical protein